METTPGVISAVVGSFLRWRHARTFLQLVLLVIAILVVLHGLFGPQLAPANLATVVTWVHYRGLLIAVLLVAGNFFCTGCPFVLMRDAGRRVRAPTLRWPRWLRVKWIGIAAVLAVVFAYELFDLWAAPRATAWLVLGYFGVALAVDLLFTGATFCKHICPIGQFSFIASTLSPTEVRVRQPATCLTCRTADCIKGRRDAVSPQRVIHRGCELALFLPAKVGNLDCTFCLDCVQACPHDNVALVMRLPGLELADGARRSGVGWLDRRADVAALAIVVLFGGLMNAVAMTAPAYAMHDALRQFIGLRSDSATLGLMFLLGVGVLPLVLIGMTAGAAAVLIGRGLSNVPRLATSYAYALIPIGVAVWVAHYGFHFLTGALTIIPVTQSAVSDLLGAAVLGMPRWQLTGVRPGLVLPLEIGIVLVGAAGSIGVSYLISLRDHPERPVLASAPWVLLTLVVLTTAIWIASQPMEMRGVSFPG